MRFTFSLTRAKYFRVHPITLYKELALQCSFISPIELGAAGGPAVFSTTWPPGDASSTPVAWAPLAAPLRVAAVADLSLPRCHPSPGRRLHYIDGTMYILLRSRTTQIAQHRFNHIRKTRRGRGSQRLHHMDCI